MKYAEFRDAIENEIKRNRSGLTWKELKDRLQLPYERPCPSWVERMELDLGLSRTRGTGRAYIWTIGNN